MTLFVDGSTGEPIAFEPAEVVLAGYTGRDQKLLQEHVDELAELGVPAPERVPTFYTVTTALIVSDGAIDVLGHQTSPEVEFILFRSDDELFVGLGSDHTDRGLEAQSVRHAKQVCPKVICPQVWRYAAVDWGRLVLRGFIGEKRELYQEGPVTALLDPEEIMARVEKRTGRDLEGVLVFSGTLPTIGEVQYPHRFAAELCDQSNGRCLGLEYIVKAIDPLD